MEITYENLAIVLQKQKNCSIRNAAVRLDAIWRARCLAAYKAKYPRKRKIDEDVAWREMRDETVGDLRAVADQMTSRAAVYTEKYEAWLHDISLKLRPRVCETEIIVRTVGESAYQSQGWGANKYARGEAIATMTQWQVEVPELTFRHEEKFNKWDAPIRCAGGEPSTGYYEHHIWANTDEPGAYLVQHSKVNMREYYRGLLKASCNVKVSNPWLPNDFPESWGMDWSGRDLPWWIEQQKEKAANAAAAVS
jgi:hypothetical protein